MKIFTIFLLSALVLFGSLISGHAQAQIALSQSVTFDDNQHSYWALIWDYTNAFRESATPGFVDVDTTLNYALVRFGERHVAYIYDADSARYVEALAIRDIKL